jgi:hypothetical protein
MKNILRKDKKKIQSRGKKRNTDNVKKHKSVALASRKKIVACREFHIQN